ncbi:diacylglycerol/lipid kinase family protein [Alteraurantiacibacter aquimixticola]|uniref:Diacylglycerol kinase n=1 Tax=Alteraurantiacibacter aquimixticola TaxID=2489173 RepID=A0A4T3EX31_9SPHN|nr:diacylglycerol kinase family protein [Alteraurantiacibacter aquimixticola]TIX49063.1 diacylglycerol kinase [Alteraurantiacibacter aquimixticola]
MHGEIHLFDRLPQVDVAQTGRSGPVAAPVRKEPLVGLIRNPHSHGNEGASARHADMQGALVTSPSKRSELFDILADYAAKQVDYIAIDGGDGTVRDVLTCGAAAFGECWPTLILLPSGKTNALAHDLAIPDSWTLADALDAARRDQAVIRHPLVVSQRDNASAQVRGFVMGAGAFSKAISLGQDAHNFGAFNAAAVGVTAVWSAMQAFFGGRDNPWRRGTRMRLRKPDGWEIEHAGGGPFSERFLMFASSLETFPAGLRPFRDIDAPIRMALFDNSRRRLLLHLPAIIRGNFGDGTRRAGFHTHGLDAFDFDVSDRFILDGEAFPPGSYRVTPGPRLRFIVP